MIERALQWGGVTAGMLVVCGALLCRLHASCTLELYARLYVPAVPIVCGCYAAATANLTAVDILQVEL